MVTVIKKKCCQSVISLAVIFNCVQYFLHCKISIEVCDPSAGLIHAIFYQLHFQLHFLYYYTNDKQHHKLHQCVLERCC